MTVVPIPMPDGKVRCECGRTMIPIVGWRTDMNTATPTWMLWWQCVSAEHVSCAVPVPTEGVSTIRDVSHDGSARLPHRPLAQPPEGSLHR